MIYVMFSKPTSGHKESVILGPFDGATVDEHFMRIGGTDGAEIAQLCLLEHKHSLYKKGWLISPDMLPHRSPLFWREVSLSRTKPIAVAEQNDAMRHAVAA
jgi:hypothetical protein